MLSRVADSLYWMSRYIERAENMARILDVNLNLMLDVPGNDGKMLADKCLPVIRSLGDEQSFKKKFKRADSESMVEFLVFDDSHSNSIFGSLNAARENARTVREQITLGMWEQINRTYLWLNSRSARQYYERNQFDFFQRVIKTLQLFQGITDTTMLHGDGWEFIQIGKYLERADKTSRLLDDQNHLLAQIKFSNAELFQWTSILASSSARFAYQKIYATEIRPKKVTELLILNEHLPRSVLFCLNRFDNALRRISGVRPGTFSNPVERASGSLLAEVQFSTVDDYFNPGLNQTMDMLQLKLNKIGAAFVDTYIRQEALPVYLPPTAEPQLQTQQ